MTNEKATALAGDAEQRKREEAEFHDHLRGGQLSHHHHGHLTSNQKFYSINQASNEFFIQWLRANGTDKRILDFGSGGGTRALEVAEFASRVTGIDISPESVRLATDAATHTAVVDRVEYLVMDGENMGFEDNSFDVIYEAGVLHHIDLRPVLGEFSRVLAPHGKAIFLEALGNNKLIHLYRKRTPHLRTAWETNHILHADDAKIFAEFFGAVEVKFFHLAALGAVPLRRTRIFRNALRVLNAVDRALLSRPFIGRQAWMVCFVVGDPIKETS